jgi:spore coat polysaccharide biosynthesis protein SpsF
MSDNLYSVFLTVRSNSSRLPGKCFLPFGNSTVLDHAVQRARKFNLNPIVCTSNEISDDSINEYCDINSIPIFRGDLSNKLKRWRDAAIYFKLDSFHIIDTDDPFFEKEVVLESLKTLNDKNLDIVHPTEVSSSGSACVGYSIKTEAIERISEKFEDVKELEMVDTFFLNLTDLRQETLISKYRDIHGVRLTLDYPEDYGLLEFLVRILGPFCNREQIINLFQNNPDLYLFNWFRNEQWAKRQSEIRLQEQI